MPTVESLPCHRIFSTLSPLMLQYVTRRFKPISIRLNFKLDIRKSFSKYIHLPRAHRLTMAKPDAAPVTANLKAASSSPFRPRRPHHGHTSVLISQAAYQPAPFTPPARQPSLPKALLRCSSSPPPRPPQQPASPPNSSPKKRRRGQHKPRGAGQRGGRAAAPERVRWRPAADNHMVSTGAAGAGIAGWRLPFLDVVCFDAAVEDL